VAFSLYIAPFPGTSCHFPEITGASPVFEERGRLARCSRRPAGCFSLALIPNVLIFRENWYQTIRHGGAEWRRLGLAESGPKTSRCLVESCFRRLIGGRVVGVGDVELGLVAWTFATPRQGLFVKKDNCVKGLTSGGGQSFRSAMSTRFNLISFITAHLSRRLFQGRPSDARSDKDLHRIMATFLTYPQSEQYLDAQLELERRKWLRDFLTGGIVAWIALGLSMISILLSVAFWIWK
jgi:hypothetical protein